MTVDAPALAGKVAIVTGSTSGIGAAIARHYARHGAGVVLNSVRSVDAGEALAAELPDAVYVQGSIAEPGVPQQPRRGCPPALGSRRRAGEQRRHHPLHPAPRPRGTARRVAGDLRDQRVRHLGDDPRGGAAPRGAAGQRRDDHVARRRAAGGQLGALRRVEGRAQPPDRPARQRPRPRSAGQRHRSGAGGDALDRGLGRAPRGGGGHGPDAPLGHARTTWWTWPCSSPRTPTSPARSSWSTAASGSAERRRRRTQALGRVVVRMLAPCHSRPPRTPPSRRLGRHRRPRACGRPPGVSSRWACSSPSPWWPSRAWRWRR